MYPVASGIREWIWGGGQLSFYSYQNTSTPTASTCAIDDKHRARDYLVYILRCLYYTTKQTFLNKMKLGRTLLILLICVLVVLALLCHIIAMATDFWLESDSQWRSSFLNIGLFRACFDDYIHPHEDPPKLYSGCHDLYSEYYTTIRDWVLPCKYNVIGAELNTHISLRNTLYMKNINIYT